MTNEKENSETLHDQNESPKEIPNESQNMGSKKWYQRFNKRQLVILLICAMANIGLGMNYQIQPLFYPELAERKGASSTLYGFFKGTYFLTLIITCPILGNYIRHIGRKRMYVAAIIGNGTCVVFYGLLDYSPAGICFIIASFILKSIQGLAGSAYFIANISTINQEFPENVSIAFSLLETVFAIGMIISPTLGGLLFEYGSYVVPFATFGSFTVITGIIMLFTLPVTDTVATLPGGYTKLLRFPGVLINYYTVLAVQFSFSFMSTVLEPHLRQFNLSKIALGLFFTIDGLTYLLSCPVWGFLASDIVNVYPNFLTGIGAILVLVAFILLGPAPYLPIEPTVWMTALALLLFGVGSTPQYLMPVIGMRMEVLRNGYPDSINTSGLVSGLWSFGFALGSLVGSATSGVLTDHIGFRNTSQVNFGLFVLVVILNFGFYYWRKGGSVYQCKKRRAGIEN